MEKNIIFRVDDFIPKNRQISFGDLCKKFSEETSLQSAPSDPKIIWFKRSGDPKNAQECLALLLAVAWTRPGWSSNFSIQDILEHVYEMGKNQYFEGKWKLVAAVLQQDFYTRGCNGILQIILKHVSEDDFFGNILPLAYSFVQNRLTTKSYLQKQNRTRSRAVRRKIRRRGYNDKGSRRPDHRWLPGSDVFVSEEHEARKKNIFDLPGPPSRYWFSSIYGADFGRSSSKKRGEAYDSRRNSGRTEEASERKAEDSNRTEVREDSTSSS